MDQSIEYVKMCNCPEIQRHNQKYSDDEYYEGYLSRKDVKVWLPRQDQLQEMIKTPELEDPFCMCVAFYKWWSEAKANWDNDPDNGYSTMEQLWLGYVMQRLHGKKWNGEEWANE